MQLLYAYKSHCCLSLQTLHQIWILSTSNPGTLTPFFRQEVVEEQGEEDKNLALKLPLNLPYKFIFPLERLLERIWEKGKKMSNSIHSISRRKTSRILKLSKEHQLGQQTNKQTQHEKRNEGPKSLYASFKKYDLRCFCFLFPGDSSALWLGDALSETQIGGFTYGVTDS